MTAERKRRTARQLLGPYTHHCVCRQCDALLELVFTRGDPAPKRKVQRILRAAEQAGWYVLVAESRADGLTFLCGEACVAAYQAEGEVDSDGGLVQAASETTTEAAGQAVQQEEP